MDTQMCETMLGLDDGLFPSLNDIPLYDNENLNLKRSPGHESVCSTMSDIPPLSPSNERGMDLAAFIEDNGLQELMRETGILMAEENEPGNDLLQDLTTDNQSGDVVAEVIGETIGDIEEYEAPVSEAPSSPISVSDHEQYIAPSPAPSTSSATTTTRKTRQKRSTRVRVATSLSEIPEIDEPGKNKAAIQAKINREKKKAYIACLEQDKEQLEKENSALRTSQKQYMSENKALHEEVAYLKSVLANQSTLSNLLQNIPNVQGVRLSTSFSDRKRSATHDHDYDAPPVKKERKSDEARAAQGGVCLHVAGDNHVSLEFCKTCASMASPSSSSSAKS